MDVQNYGPYSSQTACFTRVAKNRADRFPRFAWGPWACGRRSPQLYILPNGIANCGTKSAFGWSRLQALGPYRPQIAGRFHPACILVPCSASGVIAAQSWNGLQAGGVPGCPATERTATGLIVCNDFGNNVPYSAYLQAFSQIRVPILSRRRRLISRVINFRSEGRRFPKGRCLIPASHFFEFTGTKPPKSKWKFKKEGEDWFCFCRLLVARQSG